MQISAAMPISKMIQHNEHRIDFSRDLHELIMFVCNKLNIFQKDIIWVMTRDRKKYWYHPVVLSYFADISEINPLLSIKHHFLTARPCLQCILPQDKPQYTSRYPARIISKHFQISTPRDKKHLQYKQRKARKAFHTSLYSNIFPI